MLTWSQREELRSHYQGRLFHDEDRSRDARLILMLLSEIDEYESKFSTIASELNRIVAGVEKTEQSFTTGQKKRFG